MTKRQSYVAMVGAVLFVVTGVISIWKIDKYYDSLNKRGSEASFKVAPLPQPSGPQQLFPVPFGVFVEQDNIIVSRPIENITTAGRDVFTEGLQNVFHASAANLSYFFEYFALVQFGEDARPSAFIVVFSNDLPIVSSGDGIKRIKWSGQNLSFDPIHRQMIMGFNQNTEFGGVAKLKVLVFYSELFKSVAPRPSPGEEELRLRLLRAGL